MGNYIKIHEVSSQYGLSPRALRYYEDVGLLSSIRTDDYAYRVYDERAIRRLEQILILRKLNISIKDIKQIFASPGSKVILEVLSKKADDINNEVMLLKEFKDIVLEFIYQIKHADFNKSEDIKKLYDKASKIETRLAITSYNEKPIKETVNKLLNVNEKMKKLPQVRIMQVSPFRAFSSGWDTVENIFGPFWQWQREHINLIPNTMFGYPHFMAMKEIDNKTYVLWFWGIKESVTEDDIAPYDFMEFGGGLYAVATSVDADDNIMSIVYDGIQQWLKTSAFESDESVDRQTLYHMVTPTEEIRNALGYDQLDIYVPIKVRGKEKSR